MRIWLTYLMKDIEFEKVKRDAVHLRDYERINSFYCREIKDDFIPFFEMLDSKYEVCVEHLIMIGSHHIKKI